MGTITRTYKTAAAITLAWNATATYGANLLATNSSTFEDGTTGSWSNVAGFTLANTAADSHGGTKCLQLTAGGAGGGSVVSPAVIVTAGTNYGAFAYFKCPVTVRLITPQIIWYSDTAATTVISTTSGASTVQDSTLGWVYLQVAGLAPATAIRARIAVAYSNSVLNEVHYIDDAFISNTTGGVTSVTIQAIGGGGGGGAANVHGGGGGGGGENRTGTLATVIAGNSYSIQVGGGAAPAGTGGDTIFYSDGTATVETRAKGGGPGLIGTAGAQGAGGAGGTGGTGGTGRNGGAGGGGSATALNGAGGGGSGGDTGAGGAGTPAGVGGTGGTTNGGTGGQGANATTPATVGIQPGGGGGGASTLAAASAGAPGTMILSWTEATDSTTPTDATSRTASFIRSNADSTTPTDLSTRSTGFHRSSTDTVTLSDARVKVYGAFKADSSTPTDANAKTIAKPRTDSTSTSDLMTILAAFIKSLADSSTPVDAVQKSIAKPFADSFSGAPPSASVIFAVLD